MCLKLKCYRYRICSLEWITLVIAYLQALMNCIIILGLLVWIIHIKLNIDDAKRLNFRPSFAWIFEVKEKLFTVVHNILFAVIACALLVIYLVHFLVSILLIIGIHTRRNALLMIYFFFGIIAILLGLCSMVILIICRLYLNTLASGAICLLYFIILILVWILSKRIRNTPVDADQAIMMSAKVQSTAASGS